MREVNLKGGFDGVFALVRALSATSGVDPVLFPNLQKICIMDRDDSVHAGQTIGWRRVRALERCSAVRKPAGGDKVVL